MPLEHKTVKWKIFQIILAIKFSLSLFDRGEDGILLYLPDDVMADSPPEFKINLFTNQYGEFDSSSAINIKAWKTRIISFSILEIKSLSKLPIS